MNHPGTELFGWHSRSSHYIWGTVYPISKNPMGDGIWHWVYLSHVIIGDTNLSIQCFFNLNMNTVMS